MFRKQLTVKNIQTRNSFYQNTQISQQKIIPTINFIA